MAGFLGLQIQRDKEMGTVTLILIGLIDKILHAMGMEESNMKYTPADKESLYKDIDKAPYCEEWDYHSMVGMPLYLAGNTRLDIAYTVHQCARFLHNPKASY